MYNQDIYSRKYYLIYVFNLEDDENKKHEEHLSNEHYKTFDSLITYFDSILALIIHQQFFHFAKHNYDKTSSTHIKNAKLTRLNDHF